MLIDFNKAKEVTMPGMNHGTGMMTAKMYMDEKGENHPHKDSCRWFYWNAQTGFRGRH